MKRSQQETSGTPPTKKQALTKMIPPINIGAVSTEDEMNLKVLKFQNKKLGERLEELKVEEEKLKDQVEELKKQRESDLNIISVINRYWVQLDEDIKTILQRYEGVVEEDSEQTSNEATLSYLDYLTNLDSEQVRDEVAKRSAATKEHTRKLLHYVEMSGPIATVATVSKEVKETASEEIDVVGEGNQDEKEQSEISENSSQQEKPKSNLEADNKQLRELLTSLHEKQQTTSLEFSEIRDKYALAQKEISQLNTQLQDGAYELQKANHRVDNLVKRLNELEDVNKRLREGNTAPGEPGVAGPVQVIRFFSHNRFIELWHLGIFFQVNHMPESSVLQTAPYKCLQSQFSVLYGEVSQLRQQLEDTRRVLSTTKTQHVLQLEQIEPFSLNLVKIKVLLNVKEIFANYSVFSFYASSSVFVFSCLLQFSEELKVVKEGDKKPEQPKQETVNKLETVVEETEAKTIKPEEEGEIEEGEEEASSSKSSYEELQELRASLKKSEESQKEMKLLLDVYKGAAKDLRDKVELLTEERRLKEVIEEQKARIENLEKELEKHKGALADEEAIRRLKMADETIEQLQKNLAATKQEEDAVLAEMEFTGQAFEEMQEQNVRLLQQLREKDDANLKLMSERIKGNQIQKQIREEMDVLADQVTSLNAHRETQTQLVKKLEEREKALQNAVTSLEKELNLRQQAMELQKRKAVESAQAAQDIKIRFDSFQQQFQEAQESLSEQLRASEEEAFKSRRVQVNCYLFKFSFFQARLTCPCCNTRKKDAILTKCFHVFCFECLKTRYDTRQRKCPKCNATFGNNDFHRIYL
ncbi:PREDICTED: E3 ubiquitin-protein ligase BRE1A-like [Acropora digitifera]|uniref:E3 ubiquitin-protein ligase BRE1A-like n=1 Tax=Acropora digitifera TaxID=70779 RepID=UPI00077B237E|nr:PREDICTED: E3 ubiquitin-protein ligase BRE1A-like [Acropora digitifera]